MESPGNTCADCLYGFWTGDWRVCARFYLPRLPFISFTVSYMYQVIRGYHIALGTILGLVIKVLITTGFVERK